MEGLRSIVVLAVLLGLSTIVINGIAYAQSNVIDLYQVGDSTPTLIYGILDCHENSLNGMPAAPVVADETASGQSIIFNSGVPTTVIGADGAQRPYSTSMWDFLSGYNAGEYGVGISSNPDAPSGGTWKQVSESGTLGTQEPNLNLN